MKDLSDSAVKLAYKVSSFKKLSCHCFLKVFELVLGDWKKKFGGSAVLEYKVRFWQLGSDRTPEIRFKHEWFFWPQLPSKIT